MIAVPIPHFWTDIKGVGEWLDTHMHNPPLPEPQRWTLISLENSWGIQFNSEEDATVFLLRWNFNDD